ELRRIELNERGNSIVVVRSAPAGDEVIIVGFDLAGSDETPPAPRISSLKPSVVEQGRLKNLRLIVNGENFSQGASLLVNGAETTAEVVRQGAALEARLPKSLFDQPGTIAVQVKTVAGAISEPSLLAVVRPAAPIIERIKPDEVPGPASAFTLKIKGKNFRPSSTIFVDGEPLNTERVSAVELRAQVPAEVARTIKQFSVQVRDVAVPDLVSNESGLTIFGPRVKELRPSVSKIVAGASRFGLRVIGENFRQGAVVEINGRAVPPGRVIRQTGSLIRVSVPGRFFRNAGPLAVVVRNPEGGGASEPKELRALAPVIAGFQPEQVLAGLSDVRVDIRGENFLNKPSVFVGDGTRAFKIEKQRVRFRSDTRIVVTLTGELNELLKQPGQLRFQVVNRNEADGVPSEEKSLEVAGPRIAEAVIKPVEEDDKLVRLVVSGENFRKGAVVEFVKSGTVVRRQAAGRVRADKISITFRAKKLDALGVFEVRVVNPGDVLSNGIQPDLAPVAAAGVQQ
ncbi:MAG TPA: IPT/TIG domain-containing protein, partial [Blastocatellia bacterium]|nr:IPT/TIG domain-containing protein [Blastocatellia bacterium]